MANTDNEPSIFEKSVNPFGMIRRVIAVMSGKGGVGKSSVTALLAVALHRRGLKVGILDADVTGPSIPRLFGLSERAAHNGVALEPVPSGQGIKVISANLLLEREDQPIVWRSPLITGMIKQFFAEVDWGDLDYLLVDLSPGTGDVPLTVMQSLPLDGLVVVTSPQQLVEMIVRKAVHMAEQMRVPLVGLVENYSYLECPDCKQRIDLFGKSRAEQVAANFGLTLLGRLPVVPELATLADAGRIEAVPDAVPGFFEPVADRFLTALPEPSLK